MFGDWKDTNDYRLVTDDWANSGDLGKEGSIIKSLITMRTNKVKQRKIDFYYFSVKMK